MRYIVSLAAYALLLPVCAANAQQDDKAQSNIGSGLLRGGSTLKNRQLTTTTPTLLHSSDPFADIARSGIDRSLSYIDFQSELNLPMSQEQLDALSEYISEYSVDGNDDGSKMCLFDYEGDVDPFHPENNFPKDDGASRSLMEPMEPMGPMEHQHSDFIESSCNSNLHSATCINWSTYFNSTDLNEEVKIPCGECVILDASPNQPLFDTHLTFGQGLNIVGKLVIPNDADIEITTKYIFVQGELNMPAPPAGSGTGISSIESGNRVEINLYGTDDIMFKADNATDNAHLGEKDVSAKAFVVAGGKVDIRSMDPTCPSWVKLQSIQYGNPFPNIATNKTATQSSTWRTVNNPEQALDGLENTFTHTQCDAFKPWWEVDLEDVYTISSMNIVNRLDCCGGRLHDFDIWFLDEEKDVVGSIFSSGHMGSRKTFSTDYVNARYVKIQLRDTDCLQLGEVGIYGYLAGDTVPVESLDVLTLGTDVARCWSTKGSRILLTSDTYEWDDSQYAIVADFPNNGADGKLHMLPLPKKKTAVDETFGFPDFAVEAALLDRSLVIRGEKEDSDSEFANLGGHFIVLHTPHVHQHLEGALLQNMGQQGRLGRYPLHFHMSESVHGSTLAKNVIWNSFQRCIVIHGTHNVTVSENVAFDTKGHCFMLEDGGEWDNQFLYNLGAKTDSLPANTPVPGESDSFPSTFWITNPSNHWIGNVAAGSKGLGIWFELKLRGASANLEINQGINPKYLSLGTFDDNTAHSNGFRAGISTYSSGYRAPPGTTWNNIKSFKNKGSGIFQHGTNNIYLKGGLLADNREAARNFHHEWAVYDGVRVIGRSEHVQSMIEQGRLGSSCDQAGGISIQPNEGRGHGTTIKNSIFSGFDEECTGGKNAAIWVENDQVRNAVFDASPTLTNNTFGSLDQRRISACLSINNSPDGWVHYIAIEDDGSMSGPGFYVQDEPAITNFIDSASCQAVPDSCLKFCLGACLRLGIVSVSQDLTTRGFKMHIQDGTVSGTTLRTIPWFDELQNHLNAFLPVVLPAPTSGKYTISFTDGNDEPAWPGYASLSLDLEPACSGGLADSSQVDFVMPEPDSRCEDLFRYDNYTAGIHGWQNFFSGIIVTPVSDGSFIISTKRRKDDRGHVNLSRTLDASCIAGLGGRTFTVYGKIRMTDADGNYVQTDGSSDASPKVAFVVPGVMSQSWNLATNADGSWAEFSRDITLPDDSSSAWKATIIIDKAEKKEFHITEWGMVLTPSGAPTTSPSGSPTGSPSKSPTNLPSTSAAPTTEITTGNPVTAAPVSAVPTNLALNGFASADSECYGGYAYKAIDGDANSINHSCCGNYGAWLMVDLGKDTVNFIDNIVVKNRANCCGGRLKRFFVEVLDTEKNVVFSQYHYHSVSNGAVRTFIVNDGTAGRYVRVRHEDSLKDCLHVGEVEVWGYPIELPASQPEIIEMALNRPATASSVLGSNPPSKSNDGDVNTIHHSKCNAGNPWWQVDLGVDSFVQDVIITNRKDCCGGRLRSTTVEILDSDQNVVETRLISGPVGNGHVVQKVFNDDTSVGRYVKVFMQRQDCLHMAEVAVNGYHVEQIEALLFP